MDRVERRRGEGGREGGRKRQREREREGGGRKGWGGGGQNRPRTNLGYEGGHCILQLLWV